MSTTDNLRDGENEMFDMRIASDMFRAISAGESGGTYGGATGRYVVGGVVPTVIIPVDKVTESRVREAVAMVSAAADSADAIGFWVHEGTVYFDACNIVPDESGALMIAAGRGELAVWDMEMERELFVREAVAA